MELALISISLFTIIFSMFFIITSILKLVSRESLFSRFLLMFSAVMISLISIPELIITILIVGEFISIIAKLVAFSILSAFHILYTYRDIKRRTPPFESINISSKNTK